MFILTLRKLDVFVQFFQVTPNSCSCLTYWHRKGWKTSEIVWLRTSPLICKFLVEILETFHAINNDRQSDSSKVHALQQPLEMLIKQLVIKFVKHNVFKRIFHEVQIASKGWHVLSWINHGSSKPIDRPVWVNWTFHIALSCSPSTYGITWSSVGIHFISLYEHQCNRVAYLHGKDDTFLVFTSQSHCECRFSL